MDTFDLISNNYTTKLINIANTKKSNLIVSLDFTNPSDILYYVDKLGTHIVAVKLHLDIIDFEHMGFSKFCEQLNILKQKHSIFVIEDRKYSDIGNIVLKQFEKIKSVADIVTAHGITGLSMVKALDSTGVGILLVHQLSTSDHIIDTLYSLKVEDMAKQCDNIVGFVSQGKVNNRYLTFTPGVNIDTKSDNLGQQYNTPEIMGSKGSNFFIVGRGIYDRYDLDESCILYKERCWEQFQYKF